MPVFNSRGDVVAGVGTAPVSVNQTAVDTGGRGGWLTDDEAIYNRCPASGCEVVVYDVRSGQIRQVFGQGANVVNGGGGVWAAWNNTGLYLSDGLHLPQAGSGTVGPDGAVAYCPNYQGGVGIDVREADGRIWRLTDGIVYDLQLLGSGRAIWREGHVVHVANLPPINPPITDAYKPRAAEVNGEWWVCYFSGALGVVARPFASNDGYPLGLGDKFAHDIIAAGANLRVCWAIHEGEFPHEIVQTTLDLTAPRVPLVPPPPEPGPDPGPEPGPEPEPVERPTATITSYVPTEGRQPLTVEAIGEHTGGDPPTAIEWLWRAVGDPEWAVENVWRHTYVLPAGEWEIGLRVRNAGGEDQTSPRLVRVSGGEQPGPEPPNPNPEPPPVEGDAPTYDPFVNTECPQVAATFEQTIGAPPAPANMGHHSYRRLALGWTAEEVQRGISDASLHCDRASWFGGAPVDYSTFVNVESDEVAAAYRSVNPSPIVPTPQEMGHTAWRRLAEFWTHRDIVHDVKGEALEDGGAGATRPETPAAGPGFQGPLRKDGRVLRVPSGARFVWRGATSFRLLHMTATGDEAGAVAVMRELAGLGFNLVRVLATAKHLFDLRDDVGRTHLSRLFDLALAESLYVEIVALADTDGWDRDHLLHQLQYVYDVACAYSNVVVEGGNELGPCHETQSEDAVDVARSFVPGGPALYCPGSVHGGGLCNEQASLTEEQWAHGQATGEWPVLGRSTYL